MSRARPRRRWAAGWLLAASLAVEVPSAWAHLMAPGHATVNVVGSSAFSVVWLPAAALEGVPRDAAGNVRQEDVARAGAALIQRLQQRWTLRDGAAVGRTVRLDLILQPPDNAPEGRADQLVMLHHAVFAQPPQQVELETDLFDASQREAALTVGASGARGSEQATLRAPRARHRFFAPVIKPLWRQALLPALGVLAVLLGVLVAAVLRPRFQSRLGGVHA